VTLEALALVMRYVLLVNDHVEPEALASPSGTCGWSRSQGSHRDSRTATHRAGDPAVNVRPGPYLPTVPTIYQRKVTLKGSHPPIWRRLVVAEKLNFERPQPARPRPASKPRGRARAGA